jgi:hypothetical protein
MEMDEERQTTEVHLLTGNQTDILAIESQVEASRHYPGNVSTAHMVYGHYTAVACGSFVG